MLVGHLYNIKLDKIHETSFRQQKVLRARARAHTIHIFTKPTLSLPSSLETFSNLAQSTEIQTKHNRQKWEALNSRKRFRLHKSTWEYPERMSPSKAYQIIAAGKLRRHRRRWAVLGEKSSAENTEVSKLSEFRNPTTPP